MRTSFRGFRWAIPALLPLFAACQLDWTAVEEEALVAASVTVVLTVDPVDSTILSTDILAFLVRDSVDGRVPGASVRVTNRSDRTLTLEELPDTSENCLTDWEAPAAGTCYIATVPSAFFAPLEELTLRVNTPDGKELYGSSRIPGLFTPTRLSLQDGRCRVNPETNYRIDWGSIRSSWAHIAEAEFMGLRDNLWDEPGPLYLAAAWMAAPSYLTEMGFPRKLIEGDVPFEARKAARRLETGLPWGVTVRLAVAAIDENWANWIRPGQINVDGEVPVPSVFGDGTGMFGTAVRWTATIESRDAEEETGLVDCDLQAVYHN